MKGGGKGRPMTITQMKASKQALLSRDPGIALRLSKLPEQQRILLVDGPAGAYSALETIGGARHNAEFAVMKRMHARTRARMLSSRGSDGSASAANSDSGAEEEAAAALVGGLGEGESQASQFKGTWRHGVPWNGWGRWMSPDGCVWWGSWRDGKPWEGQGTWRSGKDKDKDGAPYECTGRWVEGRIFEGEGAIFGVEGTADYVWRGVWALGRGDGTITSGPLEVSHKNLFEGQWLIGCGPPHMGRGAWVSPTAEHCEGEWRNSEVWTGEGLWRSPKSGILFDGEWVDGLGIGVYTTADGRVTQGSWTGVFPQHSEGPKLGGAPAAGVPARRGSFRGTDSERAEEEEEEAGEREWARPQRAREGASARASASASASTTTRAAARRRGSFRDTDSERAEEEEEEEPLEARSGGARRSSMRSTPGASARRT